jgi:hypothetical protein
MASYGLKGNRRKPSGLPFNATFQDVGMRAGLHHPSIYGKPGGKDYIIEAIGSGVAFFDYDNDGWMDILTLTGSRNSGAGLEESNRLYKNNRDGTFTDVTEEAGLLHSGWSYGITIGDYNNDGYEDLFISCWGQNLLYRNNGNGTFTDVTKEAGLLTPDSTRWSTGCTWVDYDRDGRLDLFVSHYVKFDLRTVPPKGESRACNYEDTPIHCGPRGLRPETFQLYHNNGDGTFTDVTAPSGIAAMEPVFGLTAVAADFNRDGWQDIYVACDSSPSRLFINNRDGTFSEEALQRGVALNEEGREQAGMGLGIGDVNLNGEIDIFKTHFLQDFPVLYVDHGKGNFFDATLRAGLDAEGQYICWGAGIVDLDNDGLPDIFVATGGIYPELVSIKPDVPYDGPCIIYRNLGGGKFEELMKEGGPGVRTPRSCRGVAFGDFDNDGDLDILMMRMDSPPVLLRNDVSGNNHWLKVRLVGVTSNRSAIGARVVATYGGKRQAQVVMAQSSFLSVHDPRLHFGLGAETSAALEIWWPSGKQEQIRSVDADRLVTITEGAGVTSSKELPKMRVTKPI